MINAAAAIAAGTAVVLLHVFGPRSGARGIVVGVTASALFLAWSPNAQFEVRRALELAAITGFAISLAMPTRKPATKMRVQEAVTKNRTTRIAFALLFMTGAATIASSPQGMREYLVSASAGLLAVLMASRFSHADATHFSRVLVCLAVIESVLGLVEFFITQRPIPWGYAVSEAGKQIVYLNPLLGDQYARVQGSAGHPIVFGVTLAVGTLLLPLAYPHARLSVRTLGAGLFSVALFLSGSRSVIIGLALALVYSLLVSRYASGRVARWLTVSLAAAIGLVTSGTSWIDASTARLLNSGSFSNRASSLRSIPGLLERSSGESLFGSGTGSKDRLYSAGILPQNGFGVVDNQFVTTLAIAGVVGAVLLVFLFARWISAGGHVDRSLVLLFIALTLSFDFLQWLSVATIFFAFVGMARPGGNESPIAAIGKNPLATMSRTSKYRSFNDRPTG